MLRSIRLASVLVTVLCATSSAQVKSVRPTTPAKFGTKTTPLAKSECERFALAFEESVRSNEAKFAEARIDWNALYTKAMNGIPAPDKTRRDFRDASDASLRGDMGLVSTAFAAVAAGGSFRFLRVIDDATAPRALFRLAHADGGVPEYVTLLLEAGDDGAAIATDFDSASEGDLASMRLRRFFLGLSAGATRTLEEKVRGLDKLRVHHQKEIESAEEAFRAGANKKALETLEALPDELKGDRAVLLARLNAARAVSNEAFKSVLADSRRRAPKNPAVERIALDYFLQTNAHDDARVTVMALNEAIGGDAYLDWILATIEESAGDFAAARSACGRAIQHDETLRDPWLTLLSISVREEKHAETLTLLQGMDARFEMDWTGLDKSSDYAAFFASEYGRAWKLIRGTKR